MTDHIQPMPPLTTEEYAALKAEIAAHGVLAAVVIDQHGRIIDGNNRHRIATELGIDYPTKTITVSDDNDAISTALSLNCGRRHLNRQQMRDLIASELARTPGDSNRKIALRLGCDHKTVGATRRGTSGEVPHPVTVADAEDLTDRIKVAYNAVMTTLWGAVTQAMSNHVDPLRLLAAIRSGSRGSADPEWATYVYDPLIDLILDADLRRELEHPNTYVEFKPYTEEELTSLLSVLSTPLDRFPEILDPEHV